MRIRRNPTLSWYEYQFYRLGRLARASSPHESAARQWDMQQLLQGCPYLAEVEEVIATNLLTLLLMQALMLLPTLAHMQLLPPTLPPHLLIHTHPHTLLRMQPQPLL